MIRHVDKFTPNFFLTQAKEIRSATTCPLIYLGGVDSKNDIIEVLDAGFNAIALARPLIHDPNFILKLEQRKIEKSGCTRCNECIVEMERSGIRCVLND